MTGDARTRTYTWSDPFVLVEAGVQLSGLEVLRKVKDGELPPPPIASTLEFDLVEVEGGRAVFEGVPAEFLYNPIGVVHAGYTVTLLDSAMGCAFISTAGPGTRWTTLELKTSFTRALTADTGRVRVTGTVLHRGRRISTTEARAEDEEGRLCAHATSTILVLAEVGTRR
jgi:uncharacterized protein (TIGR00369 family)